MKSIKWYVLALLFPLTCFSQPSYEATIKEGESAALELINAKQASAIGISLVNAKGVIWTGTFGLVDSATGQVATDSTLFGIGSLSKLIAALAVMKLVERNVINLDTPLVTYVPNFTMLSPDYKKITVRMLLNHSAGIPGTDYRNALIRSNYPGYLNQVMQTISQSHLKAPPGYMNVYCNDCYTLVEALIKATTGKDYAQFIQEEVFIPLGMNNSKYPIHPFDDTSFARVYTDSKKRPQEIINLLASGALYSNSTDLARIAILLLNKGKPLLSEASVNEMTTDQTIGTFNPARSNSFAYGLGFDSVTQPGLLAVGFDGWAKGGDTFDYGSMLIVSPKAQLGVVVVGASSFGSEKAKVIAERMLLRALVENKHIASFPTPLQPPSVIPSAPSSTSIPDKLYAMRDAIFTIQQQGNGSLDTSILDDSGWSPSLSYQPQQDGWFIHTNQPVNEIKMVDADVLGVTKNYMIKRNAGGYGHYLDNGVVAQQLESSSQPLSQAWKDRLNKTWLVANAHPDELEWTELDPRLRLETVPGSPNLLTVIPAEDSKRHVVNPENSDTTAAMMLIIPQLNGRDLNDLVSVKHDHSEWMRYGSYMHQPISTVRSLRFNTPTKVKIQSDGYAQWVSIAGQDKRIQLTINTEGRWVLYNPNFKIITHGSGKGKVIIPAGKGLNYLTVFGKPGKMIRLFAKKTK